jgi:ketosteroid isomerase-like protein
VTTIFAIVVGGWLAASNASAPIQSSDSVDVVRVFARFHAALASGDSAVALGLLDRDAIILESGAAETREEYRSHHLPADIEFARATKSKQSVVGVRLSGNLAWVASTSTTTGRFADRPINSDGAELVVLRKVGSGWRIAAIHWSSRARRVARVGGPVVTE